MALSAARALSTSTLSNICVLLVRMAIGINHRKISQDGFGFAGACISGRDAHNAIDAAAMKRFQIIALFFPTFPRIADQDRVIRRGRIIFHSADQLDIEIVGKIRDDNGDRAGFLQPQAARQIVREIAESFDRVFNPPAHVRADIVGIIQRGGNCGDRRARGLRHFANGDVAFRGFGLRRGLSRAVFGVGNQVSLQSRSLLERRDAGRCFTEPALKRIVVGRAFSERRGSGVCSAPDNFSAGLQPALSERAVAIIVK